MDLPPDWPNRAYSAFVRVGALTWHVQRMGSGPLILLAHGTGAATHSWRGLMPALAEHFSVLAMDLPGHGFTRAPPSFRMSLPSMAAALADLLAHLDSQPEIAIGHSAGAAILARMALDSAAPPAHLIALNGAMLNIPGAQGQIFSGMAKMLALVPAVPWFFAWRAGDTTAVERMIESTGSRLDKTGIDLYARLLRDPAHVGNVLSMMANWDLDRLARELPLLPCPLTLISASGDRAVPPKVTQKVAALVPGCRVLTQPGLGHLSHEEDPAGTAALVRAIVKGAA